jgi:hypothetical protein
VNAAETIILVVGMAVVLGMGGASLVGLLREHVARVRRTEAHVAAISEAWTTPAEPSPTAWLDGLVRERILVHTVDEQSIEGLLEAVCPDGLVLVTATYLGTTTAQMGGEVFVPRATIRMVQRPKSPG